MAVPPTRSTDPNIEETEEDLRSRTDARYERLEAEEELMALGKELVKLNERSTAKLELPEDLLAAIDAVRHISAPAARNRAMRVVRAALRDNDPVAIRKRLARLEDPRTSAHVVPQREPSAVDAWCERLVNEGDAALAAFIEEFPGADRQRLRQHVRNAQKAKAQPEAPGSGRKQSFDALAKLVREHAR